MDRCNIPDQVEHNFGAVTVIRPATRDPIVNYAAPGNQAQRALEAL